MHPDLKKTLKALSLDLRHLLEGRYDTAGTWRAGDLEQRLNALGVWRDRAPLPADELPHLSEADQQARAVVDAYLTLRREAGIELGDAVAEFVRETAYTWANRLLALRCMEARGLIDEVILQKVVYGGRSLEHHRLAQRRPELCLGEDDGLFAALEAAFARQAEHLPLLFDPRAPGVALRPSAAALKQAVIALSGAAGEVFQAADALGWAYQYWNTEEKARVFEKVRTERGAKIAGADIIPATQLYTEPYMVKFLVQNSLGALWMGMHPDSSLYEGWEYYVRDADRAPVEHKFLREVTFLDPACGSGHFLLEAFDLFYTMYEEETHGTGRPLTAAEICAAILQHNLYGIDIDERAVQIAEAALWMKAAEKAFDFHSAPTNLVATNIRLPKGKDHLAAFLAQHPEDRDLRPALEVIFEGLAHADELGSLLQLEEPVEKELRYLQARMEERRGKPEQTVMFAELEKPKQGELPVGVENYEAWKARTLMRLKTHFAAEAQAADLSQAFFGRSAEKGVRLFDLLARRYDVVAANPPYMGNKKMSDVLSRFVSHQYKSGKRDLYTSFILRCNSLSHLGGRVAMVTMQGWMFLKQYEAFRIGQKSEPGVIRDNRLEAMVHLGSRAFDPETQLHDGVAVAMFILCRLPLELNHIAFCVRASTVDYGKKANLVISAAKGLGEGFTYRFRQARLLSISGAPVIYWLSKRLFDLLTQDASIKDWITVSEGAGSRNEARFVRRHWEHSEDLNRWWNYAKGGGYQRWFGLQLFSIDWEFGGLRVKTHLREKFPYLNDNVSILIRDSERYGNTCLSYTDFANGSVSCRFHPSAICSDQGPGVFSDSVDLNALCSYLNSRLCSFYMRALSPNPIHVRKGYLYQLPSVDPIVFNEHLASWGSACIEFREMLTSLSLEERNFLPAKFLDFFYHESTRVSFAKLMIIQALLNSFEAICEHRVFSVFALNNDEILEVIQETGAPSGFNLLIEGYDQFPVCDNVRELILEYEKSTDFRFHERATVDPRGLSEIRNSLRILYECGFGNVSDADIELEQSSSRQDEDEDDIVGKKSSIPNDTFLEELSQKLQIHPISVYWLLKEGIEQEGWRCLPEERRINADRFTVLILRLLGHRWPKQLEGGEPVPAWADPDGIIPLTEGTAEPALLDRIRERLSIEFPGGESPTLEREFQDLMGGSLETWLGQTFFKHHTSQFKKRPIAWQLQSGRWTSRQKPAFACLVYYHKMDGDTLATLQSQYVRPLRQRYETELRGIESIPANARSARQDARRTELGDLIQELGDFDAALGRVAAEGFASPALEQLIARESVDRWCSVDGVKAPPEDRAALLRQEQRYLPDLNDGVRVNIAPLQKAGLLAADVLAKKDLDQAIADRAEWRADERRWCREGKLPKPGWWE